MLPNFRILRPSLLLSLLLLVACGGSGSGSNPGNPQPPAPQPTPFETRVALLNDQLSPLSSTAPDSPIDDLDPLARVAMAQIVGMGEATHGTREFFELKHKIFRWLVETRNFRVFAMESDIAEAVYIDHYVQTGEGDLEQIMIDRMHYWPWYTEEVRNLIQWMADYNAANPDEEPLRYIGVDCQTVGLQPDLIIAHVEEGSPDLLDMTEAAVTPLRVSMAGAWTLYAEMSDDEYNSIRDDLLALRASFEDHQAALIAGSSQRDFRMLMYLTKSLIDSHQAMFGVYNAAEPVDNWQFRERCMADNVQLIEWLEDEPDVRIALWAHNAHVAAVTAGAWKSMGGNLRLDLGNAYSAIGFSFAHGEFMAQLPGVGVIEHSIAAPPLAGSLNELFHAADVDQFILDVGAIPGSALLNWLRNEQPEMWVGSVFNPENPIQTYYQMLIPTDLWDLIIHVDRSSPSELLPIPD